LELQKEVLTLQKENLLKERELFEVQQRNLQAQTDFFQAAQTFMNNFSLSVNQQPTTTNPQQWPPYYNN
jgi:hypothetical protein